MVDEMEQPPGCVFHRLKTIKMKRFYGIHMQMHMVKFLLEKAVALKTMVLVTPKAGSKGYIRKHVAPMRLLHEQLLLLPKVSTTAQFVLQEREARL